MNPYHVVMDACLWFCSILWLIGFLARGPKPRRYNKRLHGSVFGRKQAD